MAADLYPRKVFARSTIFIISDLMNVVKNWCLRIFGFFLQLFLKTKLISPLLERFVYSIKV